ncbi:Mobile element protein [hydrothermal vent metagenome]|uniref:Mobile element protein n=1 Tax=hydrothermal vent metagenome TaxID=652676 RepID=A0A3B1AVJ2_9ZZZZ
MQQLREVLRLRLHADLSLRQIKNSLQLSLGTLQKVSSKANELSLTWEQVEPLDDQQLSALFYPAAQSKASNPPSQKELPEWTQIRFELGKKGVTKYLLWEEYQQQYSTRSYSYPQFCLLYRTWLGKQKRSMRQVHKAGEKLFVDYAGQTMPIVNPDTGEIKTAQIFVAVLGASNYTYAEATWSQKLPDWLGSHVRAFEFIGGVPEVVVPDNLKSGVTQSCRYDPDINLSYQQLGAHYQTAIIPARPRKPKDKAKAEVGVQIIERWILARLRHQTFFTLAELNLQIKALLKSVNHRPFKKLKGTRAQWFESLDKPALKPLPRHPYEYTDIKTVKVNIDYHVQYDGHLYSIPHHLVGERIELHAKAHQIRLYFQHQQVAVHVRSHHSGMTTVPSHMPVSHAKHLKWTPGRLMNWAKDIGDEVLIWVKAQLEQRQHPEQAYRVCLGLLNLHRSYPATRINSACGIANKQHLHRLKHIREILKNNQDKLADDQPEPLSLLPQQHENIRGSDSFH